MNEMSENESKHAAKDGNLTRRSFLSMALVGGLSLVLTGCGTPRSEQASSSSVTSSAESSSASSSVVSSASAAASAGGNAMIVCFSYDGHTWAMANRIGELAGIEPRRIEPVTPYPDAATGDEIKGYDSAGYDETVDIAKEEQADDTMPPFTLNTSGWDEADVVFLGYPIWWGDAPQIVKNFASEQDWSGKTVIPFSSNEGSRWGTSLSSLQGLCTGATFLDGIAIRGDEVESSLDSINSWYQGLGL